jgi:hypothetical protein
MRFTTKVTSLVAAGGAAALGIGLLAFAPGVGASFSSQADAVATFDVGTLSCSVTSSAAGATADGNSVTIPLGRITSSAAGQLTAPVSVNNTGTIPLKVSWDIKVEGSFFQTWHQTYVPVPQNETVASNTSRAYTIGASWDELDNSALGSDGTLTYTANCSDQAAPLSYVDTGTATHTWDGSHTNLTLAIPAGAPDGAGVEVHLNGAAGSALPTDQPDFAATNPGPGNPRLSILMSDGTRVVIDEDGLIEGHSDWSAVLAAYNGKTVRDAMVVADTGNGLPYETTVSCINYSGTALFGTCG